MKVKMIGPKECERLSLGDLSIEVEDGECEVPDHFVPQMRQHGFRLATEPEPPKPIPPPASKFQIVERIAVASGLNKGASLDAIIVQVEKLYAFFATAQAEKQTQRVGTQRKAA